jgi:hypothetical protein
VAAGVVALLRYFWVSELPVAARDLRIGIGALVVLLIVIGVWVALRQHARPSARQMQNTMGMLNAKTITAESRTLAEQLWRDYGARMMANLGCVSRAASRTSPTEYAFCGPA